MLSTTNTTTVKSSGGMTIKNKMAVETPKMISEKKGAKRNQVLEAYSLSDQINAIRKAILTGDKTALQAMDDAIEAIINA